ncbi:MAG: phosphate signaling complex protein PhoU [Akkermansiaceae bacterium]
MAHILKNYDDDLRALSDSVIGMGANTLAAIEKALMGLTSRDSDLCYDVVEEDEIIDQQEKKIDEKGMAILLRYNPVASDLRHVLSSINICRSLERIGDHAVNIAKRARKIIRSSELEETRLVEPLFAEARKVVSAVLTAYSDVDESMAHAVIKMDQRVDEIHESLSKALTLKISEGGCDTEALLNIIFISRSLERIGDLAVNIAEDVVFATSAEDIRHT